ncbi:MAG: SDR family NAD(P)-dependent oxidoreductase [Burkholderiales bacterium]|nr:SDR family NAD(P)-dependent oxidoreductase [Burkholderiales bacterium]
MNDSNKTYVITGACGNLGRATVAALRHSQNNLVLIDRSAATLEQVFGPVNAQTLLCEADLCKPLQTEAVIRSALQKFSKIDVLCNITGGFRMGTPVHETPDEDWDFLYNINVRSMLNMVRAVAPGMVAQRSGKIVNLGAFGATRGSAGMGAYCAAKDAVLRITESLSAELRDNGINVNCILPSIIDTPENRAAMPDADPARWVAPEALADVICFLSSDAARAIHGVALPVNGLC